MIYIEELTHIPRIPNEILLTVEQAEQNENVFQGNAKSDVYGSYKANPELVEWVQQYFDYPVITRYQVIHKNLPIHRDDGILGMKANYLITSGGDVLTQWWDDDNNPTKLCHEVICDTHKWYNLNIQEPHCVINLTSTRFSVTVRKK